MQWRKYIYRVNDLITLTSDATSLIKRRMTFLGKLHKITPHFAQEANI